MSAARKPSRLGCDHCDGSGPAPGHLYGDNGARGGPCPICNPITEREIAWRNAEAQRDAQRRAGSGRSR